MAVEIFNWSPRINPQGRTKFRVLSAQFGDGYGQTAVSYTHLDVYKRQRYITTLFGFVFFGHQVGSFLGVWLGGVVYEATHSYDLIWIGAMALGVLAAVLHWPIDDRELPRIRAAVAAG